MGLRGWNRRWHGRVGSQLQHAERAGAVTLPEVNSAGVLELDGNVCHHAHTSSRLRATSGIAQGPETPTARPGDRLRQFTDTSP
jgi:hypothetical protein